MGAASRVFRWEGWRGVFWNQELFRCAAYDGGPPVSHCKAVYGQAADCGREARQPR